MSRDELRMERTCYTLSSVVKSKPVEILHFEQNIIDQLTQILRFLTWCTLTHVVLRTLWFVADAIVLTVMVTTSRGGGVIVVVTVVHVNGGNLAVFTSVAAKADTRVRHQLVDTLCPVLTNM